ncbi:MAG: DUF6384 family protein [Trueperaceae bacterium]
MTAAEAGPPGSAQAGEPAEPLATPAPLDEVMLAMDVVDTLRHRHQLVAQELQSGERDEDMLARLRQIYAAQGIDVPDRILEDGVAALREERFVYKQPERSAAKRWARIYVHRGRWALRLLILAAVVAGAVFAYDATVRAPTRELVADLDRSRAAVHAVAEVDAATRQADTLYQQAQSALRRNDTPEARTALASLETLREQVEASYTLRIALEPDTGVWRIPDVNVGTRNYYVIVEAIDANGRRLTVPIMNEETGRTERVAQWGLRVDEATFERVRDDKLDDGIIQNRTFGEKQAGYLEPDYLFPTTGGAITDW